VRSLRIAASVPLVALCCLLAAVVVVVAGACITAGMLGGL
jgi:hypothetical protein